MDLTDVAKYFDSTSFVRYNDSVNDWEVIPFVGQLKSADLFVSIWNRPTRKRMLYTAPSDVPNCSLIKTVTGDKVYMVGTGQIDIIQDVMYRQVTGLHLAAGPAVVTRLIPQEVAGVKQWAVSTLIKNTYADSEMRSVNENQSTDLLNYGHFFLFFPLDTPLQRHDNVLLQGKSHYILETYVDSGYLCARSTVKPDERVNFTYLSKGAPSFNPATNTVTPNNTTYFVTAKVQPIGDEDRPNSDVSKDQVKVMILESFISFDPKVTDQLTFQGVTYTVFKVYRDSTLAEWHLTARA